MKQTEPSPLIGSGPLTYPLIGWCPPCHHNIVSVCGEHSPDKWLLVSSFLSSLSLISGSYQRPDEMTRAEQMNILHYLNATLHISQYFVLSFRIRPDWDWRLSLTCSLIPVFPVPTSVNKLPAPVRPNNIANPSRKFEGKIRFDRYNILMDIVKHCHLIIKALDCKRKTLTIIYPFIRS